MNVVCSEKVKENVQYSLPLFVKYYQSCMPGSRVYKYQLTVNGRSAADNQADKALATVKRVAARAGISVEEAILKYGTF